MGATAGPRSLRHLLQAVLSIGLDLDLPAMLRRITEAAASLADARYAALGVLDATKTELAEFITVGIDEEGHTAIGDLPKGHGILGLLIVDAKPLHLPDISEHPDSFGFPPEHPPMTSFLGVPIRVRGEVFGNLYLTDKMSGEVFTDVDEELVMGLAAAAGVAIENTRLHERVQDLAITDDRERIARDLHDQVMQQLFATGLTLQAGLRLVRSNPASAEKRIEDAVDELDQISKQIRTAVFELEKSRPLGRRLREGILDIAWEASRVLGFEPTVVFDGPVDTGVDGTVGAELTTTLREAMSNVIRHAEASRVEITVVVDTDTTLRVTDDGIGPPDGAARRGRGIKNMAHRADSLGGHVSILANPGGGTTVEWSVPQPAVGG